MRSAVMFAAGFVAGVIFLGALLWQTGSLRAGHTQAAARVAAAPAPAVTQPAAAAPPEADRAAPALPPVTPPAMPLPNPQNIPTPAGPLNPPPEQAMRMTPEGAPRLLIPVAGVTADQLHDNFNEVRDGHMHEALDIMAPRDTPVLAADEGNIVKLFNSRAGGLTIYQFDDSQTYCYYYAHLDHYAKGLKEGTLVRRGDVIAYVGTSGDAPANAPHLHFAVFRLGPQKHWWQGTAIDPYPLLNGP